MVCEHSRQNGKIFIPPTHFRYYIAIIRVCKTQSYLKHVKIWHISSSKVCYTP